MEMEFLSEAHREKYFKLSPSKRIPWLKEYCLGLGQGDALNSAQKLLHDLEIEERGYSALESRQHTNPHEFDVLINDINESDLQLIGDEFGVHRLQIVDSVGTFPVDGVIYGPSNRIFVPLTIQKRNICIVVIFLLDTLSPSTYLREDTLIALGFSESIPSATLVKINAIGLTIFPSRCNFINVDLLGQDFLVSVGALLTVNYPAKEVKIIRV